MYRWILVILLSVYGCNAKRPVETPAVLHPAPADVPGIFNSFFSTGDSLRSNRQFDLLELHNSSLEDSIIKYKETFFIVPDTLFKSLLVVVSHDKRFCIVSWDSREGGTMIDFHAIALYKTSSGIRHYIIQQTDNGDTIPSLIAYDTIVSLVSGNRTIYLGRGFGRGSTALWWENLMAFEIGPDSLFRPAVFPVPTGYYAYPLVYDTREYSPELTVEFDIRNREADSPESRPVIIFKDNNNSLMIPVVSPSGGFTSRYHFLYFNGRHFKAAKRDDL